jgi:tetratricopeptide (TPR) repeat protein
MKTNSYPHCLLLCSVFVLLQTACKQKPTTEVKAGVSGMDLKRGGIVACGPADKEFGSVQFASSCSAATQKDFNLGIAMLHSFEYDESEKAFARVIDADPNCAMAYWGVAMSNFHQVWPSPPTPEELAKGSKAVEKARSLSPGSISSDYINTIAAFYKDYANNTQRERILNYAKAMGEMYKKYPGEKEVAVFYALSLTSSADPADKTFSNQKKAGDILNGLYPGEPNHPGVVHYIIHSYDSPELASMALDAARKYAAIAPSSAHAQHMPSHIFTRLGLWDESIQSNKAAAASAKCYAESTGIKGHWDEELHTIDYMVYAYLQKGENKLAKEQVDYLQSFSDVSPVNFKVLYSFAAAPARYYLENKMWKEAAAMEMQPNFPWKDYPWQEAIIHFTRLLGAANNGDIANAKTALKNLEKMHAAIAAQKDVYKAGQVMIQVKTGEAWVAFAEGKKAEAIQKMKEAAVMEDKTEKSPVTPGEVLPAKQLLADMLMQANKPAEALTAYEEDLKKHPNRFNSIYGAALASEKTGDSDKAKKYYEQLTQVASSPAADRAEIGKAKLFLKG